MEKDLVQQTSKSIKALVQQELLGIRNDIVKNGLKSLLVSEPILHMRGWDYGKDDEEFECWTVAVDNQTDTSIVYSDYGFRHGRWGLVSTKNLCFGMDCGWFENLGRCYLDSFDAAYLPIWCVRKEIEKEEEKTLTEKMDMHIAFEIRDEFAEIDKKGRYFVDYVLE